MAAKKNVNGGMHGLKPEDDEICELEHLRKLFIGGLAPYTSEDNLKEFYEQWGKVVDCVVMKDQVTKKSRGFGFITYTKAYMVDKAQSNRPHIIDGKTVEAKRALPRPERESRDSNITVRKIFVGGLKDNHDEECLREYFKQFGNVVSVKILTDKVTGKRRGFAFVEFDDYDAVDKAILQKTHSIKYVLVDVKKSVYKQEMQKRAAAAGVGGNVGTQSEVNPNAEVPVVPYQAGSQANTGYTQPPPNYNHWGPPPNNCNGYSQPPMNWNWNQPPQNSWTGPANGQWNQGSYGPPPNWNWNNQASAQTNWNSGPPTQQPPQQQQPVVQNFGAGYQQHPGGGKQKANVVNSTVRKNPYTNTKDPHQAITVGNNTRRY